MTSAQSLEALLAISSIARQRHAHLVRVGPLEEDPAQAGVDSGQLSPASYRYQIQRQSETDQHLTIWTPEGKYDDLVIPLLGHHQAENAAAALATLEMLRRHDIQWNEHDLRAGFYAVHWPARIEIVGQQPTIVVDGAHNADSMCKLVQTLRATFSFQRLVIVLGVVRSKDLAGIIRMLSDVDHVVLTRMNNPRAVDLDTLEALFAEQAPHVTTHKYEHSEDAMNFAREFADPRDLICATGSLYLAGEVLRWAAAHGATNAASEIEGVDH